MEDSTPSWIVMTHVHPIPEDEEVIRVFNAVAELVSRLLPHYDLDVSSVYANNIEFIDLTDLHEL